jgi:hypothetical protein
MAVGKGFTTIPAVARQLVGKVYVTVTLPGATPLTIPGELPMAARAVSLLLHDPPGVVLESEIVLPIHTFVMPAMGAGSGLTVKIA